MCFGLNVTVCPGVVENWAKVRPYGATNQRRKYYKNVINRKLYNLMNNKY